MARLDRRIARAGRIIRVGEAPARGAASGKVVLGKVLSCKVLSCKVPFSKSLSGESLLGRILLATGVLAIAALAAPFAPARAAPPREADRPSFVCTEAAPEVERLICSDPALAALDRRVAARAAAALAAVKAMGAGGLEALAILRATERGWIAGRDACADEADEADKAACVKREYLRREGALVARYTLEKPASVATFACDGDRADTVTVSVFNTDLPSVRIEYGGKVDTGAQTPTADGTRYEASLGRSIWIKGDEATFVWPEGRQRRCLAVK